MQETLEHHRRPIIKKINRTKEEEEVGVFLEETEIDHSLEIDETAVETQNTKIATEDEDSTDIHQKIEVDPEHLSETGTQGQVQETENKAMKN